jgi:general stress protein YciG
MTGKSKRGFASMDRARQREIAAKGGRAAHAKGTAHVWTAEEARVAGRKGGETVSQDRQHMSAIGKEGGESRSAALRAARLRRAQEQQLAQMQAQRAANGAIIRDREVPIPMSHDGRGSLDRAVSRPPMADGPADVRRASNADQYDEHPPERSSEQSSDRRPERPADRPSPSGGNVRPPSEQRTPA